jgi:superfamily II DNA or RNA helicase
MKVVLKNASTIVCEGGQELQEWREEQKREVPGAQYIPAVKKGFWDGFKRPGSLKRYKGNKYHLYVERGFLNRIHDDFPEATFETEYEFPPELDVEDGRGTYDIGRLRDYQLASLKRIFSHRWGRIALATNAGKGAIIGIAAAMAADAGMRSIILTDEVSVFQALEEEIRKWGLVEPGLVEAGREDPPTEDVVLAMVPTLANRLDREPWLEWLDDVQMALLDEADRAKADRWKKVLSKLPNTHYRVGFSGSFDTHDPVDEMQQEVLMGPILIQVKNNELVDRGISAKPKVELWKYEQDITNLPPIGEWWNMSGPERRRIVYEEGVMYDQQRHELIRRMLHPSEQNVVVVNRVDHGHILADYLPDSVFLYGEDSKEVRHDTLSDYRSGDFQNLIVTRILDRGTNLIGHAVGLIFASGEGSETQTLQRIGRGLRKTDGKEYLFLRDIIDVPPPWGGGKHKPYKYFRRASKKRIELYNDEGFDIRIVNKEGVV